ncbi:MAG: FAD-dependent oxidoreductase, partial [Ardenticatenales bacterium]|nr:FAD-dependent oxidoreductase [Ardenticatenales bacterium]
ENYRDVAMTWFWSRMFKRTPSLIYPDGGFQTITDALVRATTAQGVTIHLSTPVQTLRQVEGSWEVASAQGTQRFDRVIATVSPGLMAKLVPQLAGNYLASLKALKSMGAVVMTVSLTRKLTERSYWLNLNKQDYPMLSLVEHTNMVDARHYGGDHLIYMGDYLPSDHPYLSYDAEQLFELYEPVLKTFNPAYERSWVRQKWIFSTTYAQPVPPLHYAKSIPPLKTPLPGLYFASMSQVYPWDRGTNYAVEMGRRVAKELLGETVNGVAMARQAAVTR